MLLEIPPILLKRGLRCIAKEWDIGLGLILTEKIVEGIVSGITNRLDSIKIN